MTYLGWVTTYGPTYLDALGWTAVIAVLASVGAIIWGCALLLARLAGGRWGARAVDAYVQVFRNTPVLLPIYLIYFGFPLIGLPWPAAVCGGLALVLQNGAYVSEILRGSVKAIDRVQFDAAKSIGLSAWHTFRKVTLPQVLVYSIPALGNQVVLLLKDTSLLSAVAVTELTMQAKLLTEQTGAAYEAFIVVAVLYLTLVAASEVVFRGAPGSRSPSP
ncbi:MAG: amino acid ABC transporter permease [Candidatus Rokuibacteriota bacterium]|nr:MAG: amino acid ABC transporter permease [Candidatus Rokubacteria bacterium]